jgi:alkylhydroperoxidase family enzyme
MANQPVSDELYEDLRKHFSDKEISDLTFTVSLMNACNRIGVSMKV